MSAVGYTGVIGEFFPLVRCHLRFDPITVTFSRKRERKCNFFFTFVFSHLALLATVMAQTQLAKPAAAHAVSELSCPVLAPSVPTASPVEEVAVAGPKLQLFWVT